ncbi:MAG: HD domain-containing protein [Candidatus Omnitrophica bacterium]|nr:HD domain-containing protein [Candidatus Omnitrophota bacterium]
MSIKNSSILTKRYKTILSAVHMVYRLVNSTYNVTELSLRLTRLLCQFIDADASTIYILDPQKKKVVLKAIFDNRINILQTKKKDLAKITQQEKEVIRGYAVFEKNFIGLPLVADETIGAIFLSRKRGQKAFSEFDSDMLSVVVEQSVTAIKNLQLYEEQQKIILGSIEFIGKLLEKHGHASATTHTPVHFKIVRALAEKLEISQEGVSSLYYASILHDAGAIDVPYNILSKKSQLNADEFKIIRNHPTRSAELIKPVEFLKPILPIVLYHHENYDGTGYPSGLKKEQIPIGARIMRVVDAFEAMRRERPYKEKMTISESLKELKNNSGTQFDPNVVSAFLELSQQKKFRNYLSKIT